MKEVIEHFNVLRKYFRVRKYVSDKFKLVFILLKIGLKTPLKLVYLVKKQRKNYFG